MADEPTGNLDSVNGQHIYSNSLLRLNQRAKNDPDPGHARSSSCGSRGPCHHFARRFAGGGPSSGAIQPDMRFLRTASKIAWRELRSSPGALLFVAVAVAVGVGALSGVKGFGAAFRSMLFSNAKQLTASDFVRPGVGRP